MKVHELKSWPKIFQAMLEGRKTFDFRKNDRGFELADILVFKEWNPDKNEFSGREYSVQVTYILTECPNMPEDCCIMQVNPLPLHCRMQVGTNWVWEA